MRLGVLSLASGEVTTQWPQAKVLGSLHTSGYWVNKARLQMCFANFVFTVTMAQWATSAGDKDTWEKDVLEYEPVFYFHTQLLCILRRGLSGWDEGWRRVCCCQILFWKGLALNSCAQTVASKKQAIRPSTPEYESSLLRYLPLCDLHLNLLLESPELFWGNYTSLSILCLDI